MGAEENNHNNKLATATSAAANSTGFPPSPSPQHHYGTFQGVAYSSQPSQPRTVVGIPPPAPPLSGPGPAPSPYYFPQGYQAVPDVRTVREPKLACCGLGLGWLLFIAGFFFACIPWYVGALILVCGSVDHREKPGLVACMIASILGVIAIVFGATGGAIDNW